MAGFTEAGDEQRVVHVGLADADGMMHLYAFSGLPDVLDANITEAEGIGHLEGAFGSYITFEETMTAEQVPGASLSDRPLLEAALPGTPDVKVHLNREALERIRPPLKLHEIEFIASRLGAMGIRSCEDAVRAGLVGLIESGLLKREVVLVSALTKHLSGQTVPVQSPHTGEMVFDFYTRWGMRKGL